MNSLKEQIENGIKEKFNETSDILDDFVFDGDPNKYFLYAMLKKEFEFENEFDELDDGKFEVLFCNLSRKQDVLKTLYYLRTSDITKVPGFYFHKTDNLKISFKKPVSSWCVDGEHLEEEETDYEITVKKNVKILLPRKNVNTLFQKKLSDK